MGSEPGAPGAGLGATREPLAAVHDVALLDLDGVVYVGPEAVPHAARSIQEARQRYGMRSGFVTNNASRPPEAVAEHLRSLGVTATAGEVVTSAQAGARVLAEHLPAGARVLAVGGPGVAAALEERGFVPVGSADEAPDAVMQGYGPDVGWRQLAEACLAISRGVRWVATNEDRTVPTPRGRVLGNGALVEAVRYATGVQPVAAGKPRPPLMLESVERMDARSPLVVGDRLDTDIEGARRSGLPSLLVLTGVTDWHHLLDVPVGLRPTYLDRDLRGLLTAQPHVRVTAGVGILTGACGRARVRVPVRRPAEGDERRAAGIADPAWWPAALRAPRDATDLDLELVRALVAVAWEADERGLAICGPAVDAGEGAAVRLVDP